MEDVICLNCNEVNSCDKKFCSTCGSSLKMEDVICEECNALNQYNHNICHNCGSSLKEECSTCGNKENITFVKAGVCQAKILKERSDRYRELTKVTYPIIFRFVGTVFGSLFLTASLALLSFFYLPQIIIYVVTIGLIISAIISFYIHLQTEELTNLKWQFSVQDFERDNPIGVKLLRKVGWEILRP